MITSELKPRSLQRDLQTYVTFKEYMTTSSNSNPVLSGTYSNLPKTLDVAQLNGYDTVNYREKVRRKELIPHTPFRNFTVIGESAGVMDVTYYVEVPPYQTWVHYYGGQGFSDLPYETTWILTEGNLSALLPTSYDQFVQDAAARIYSSGHDSLTFLAEIVQVRNLFFNTARKLIRMDFPRNWRRLTNDYLEVRYGWRPFINDIISLNRAIRNLNHERTRWCERVGYTIASNSVTTATESNESFRNMVRITTDTYTVKARGSVIADIEPPSFSFNPLITAWELIPYSFVIDWFLSVGRSLAAMSFLTLQHKYCASAGFRVELSREFHKYMVPRLHTSGTFTQDALCTAALEVRTPCTIPLTPHLTCRLGIMQITDLLALILQRVR